MNHVVLIGRLTKDPELKKTSNNISYCNITVAVDRTFNSDKTDFIPVTVWRAPAENVCKHLQKGALVAVQGSIQVSSFVNNDNQKIYRTDVQANNVKFLGGKRNQNNSNESSYENNTNSYNNKNNNNVFFNKSKTKNNQSEIINSNDNNVFEEDPWSEDL